MSTETHKVVTELVIDASGYLKGANDAGSALDKVEAGVIKVQRSTRDLTALEEKAAAARQRQVMASMGGYDATNKSVAALYRVYGSAERAMNPAYAAEQRYQRQIAATQELLQRRVIDEQRAAATLSALRDQQIVDLQRYKQAAESADQADRRHAAGNDNMARSRRQGLMFQSFDIGTTLAGGMNPALIAAQQGPQIVQMYAGNGGVNAALKDTATLLGGVVRAAGPIGAVVGVGALAFADFRSEIEASTGVAVSFGDVLLGTIDHIAGGIKDALQPAIDGVAPYAAKAWSILQDVAAIAFNGVVQAVVAAVNLIQFTISAAPGAFEIYGKQAANKFIEAMNWMVEQSAAPINKLIDAINWITQAGESGLGHIKPPKPFEPLETSAIAVKQYTDALETLNKANEANNKADYLGNLKDGSTDDILKRNADRLAEIEKNAKGAGRGLSEADKEARAFKDALGDIQQQADAFTGIADGLLDKLFPGEAARREADRLMTDLTQFGSKLDTFQRTAVEHEITDLRRAAEFGLRNLPDETRSQGRDAADALQETLGDAFKDIFSGGIDSADEFFERVLGTPAEVTHEMVNAIFDQLQED